MGSLKTIRNLIVILAVLALTGYLRMPVEQDFTEDLRERKIAPPQMKTEIWGEMGQTSLAGAFGGLRSLMASLMSLAAYSHFENKEWYDLQKDYEVITALDPYNVFYWDHAGWHLGYNAASWARNNKEFSPVRRRAMEMRYLELGEDFYREGLKYLPHEDKLWFEIGAMWSNEYKRPDPERAAEAFAKVRFSANPVYRRRYLITIAQIPGREREAYEEAMRLLREEAGMLHLQTASFRSLLMVLSSNPDLPEDEPRITVDDIWPGRREQAYQDLYNYRLRAKRQGFYEGRLDEILRGLIFDLQVPDALNPFLTSRRRPIPTPRWREAHEREQRNGENSGIPDWMLK